MTLASATPTANYVVKALGTGKIDNGWISAFSTVFTLNGIEDTITAHAGGTQASAFALSSTLTAHHITVCATAADSVKLPAGTVGDIHIIFNSGSAAAQVFGAGTDTINDVATATGVSITAGTGAIFQLVATGKWYSIGLGGGAAAAGTLTGTTLASNVVNSSLTSFGASGTFASNANSSVSVQNTNSSNGNAADADFLAQNDVSKYVLLAMRSSTNATTNIGLTNGAAHLITTSLVGMGIGTFSATPLTLGANNTEIMRLFSAGRVAIGSTSDDGANKLQVTGSAYVSTSIELGHASDTTLARSSAGVVTIEGARIHTEGSAIGDTTPAAATVTTLIANVGSPVAASAQITSGDGSIDPRKIQERFDTFLGASALNGTITWTASDNGGTTVLDVTDTSGNGVILSTTGSSAGQYTGLFAGSTTHRTQLGIIHLGIRVRIPTLSNATNEFSYYAGMLSGTDPSAATDGIYWLYDRLNVSANWQLVCRSASTSTVRDTGIAVASNAWQTLDFVVNAAGTSVQAYVAGVAVGAAITTNITNAALRSQFKAFQLAGTGGTLKTDYWYECLTLTTPG